MRTALLLLVVAGLGGCGGEDDAVSPSTSMVFQVPKAWSDWSEPVLVEELNTSANDANPCLSEDGLTVYFTSNRTGSLGGNDIWFSQRASQDDTWGTPQNPGSPVNTTFDESGPSLSQDGLLLFFLSTRTGTLGSTDVYLARRSDPADNSAWEEPENIGTDVNTSGAEQAPHFQFKGEGGDPSLYFQRGSPSADLFVAPMTKDGHTLGVAVELTTLNSTFNDAGTMIRKDGLELIFNSNRTGTLGFFDLFVSTRASTDDPWPAPVHLGSPPNSSTAGEFGVGISFDSRTLLISRDAGGGGAGGFEIWVSTRTVVGNGGN